MRVAFDTNVVAYAEGYDDNIRRAIAEGLLSTLSEHEFVLPVQVCAELTRLMTRKFRRDLTEAAGIVRRWQRVCPIHAASTTTAFDAALDLATEHRFQIFDAVILAASAEAGCRLLLSEDMQDGFVWRGVTVANPFATSLHPLLTDALRG